MKTSKELFVGGVVLFFLLLGCNRSKGNPTITGVIEGGAGETIYLEMLEPNKAIILDSAKIEKDGTFRLHKKALGKSFYQLRVGQIKPNSNMAPSSNIMVLVTDSTEVVKVTAKFPDCSNTYQVEGSEETVLLQDINAIMLKGQVRLDSLNTAYQKDPDGFDEKAANQLLIEIQLNQAKEMKTFAEQHKGKFISLQAIAMLKPEDNLALFTEAADLLNKNFPDNIFVNNFIAIVGHSTQLSPGTSAPDFTVATPDGQPISLSQFKGQYVLIDFWASWCRPCRMQNPEMVALYKKFKGKHFEIFGVSLDQNKDAWVQAIADDKLTWPHGSDLKYWDAAPAKLYNIEYIPFNYLIGPDGLIIAKNLTGDLLEAKLNELINAKTL